MISTWSGKESFIAEAVNRIEEDVRVAAEGVCRSFRGNRYSFQFIAAFIFLGTMNAQLAGSWFYHAYLLVASSRETHTALYERD